MPFRTPSSCPKTPRLLEPLVAPNAKFRQGALRLADPQIMRLLPTLRSLISHAHRFKFCCLAITLPR
ncbi:hypothetical protein V3C99_007089 [Haemonchus contortus]|uniref:Uncharacterized protein n=1 Tax=Haemonchus contortus TaxID=6289 RepID=A0A7I4YRT3_HAECO